MKPPKTLIRIGVVLLAVVAAVLLVRTVLNYTEGRALTRALAGLKEKGIPLTAKELTAPCPEEDNAARLLKAFENIVTLPGRQIPGTGRRAPGNTAASGLISRAWTDFSEGKPLTPDQRSGLSELIAKNAKAFELIAEMGEKPCFLYRDPDESLLESPTPYAIRMIQATKLLFFAAFFSAEAGDVGTAVDEISAGLRFSPLAAREGTLIPFLVAVAQTRILSQFLGEIFCGRAMGDEDLARLIGVLDPGPWRGRLAGAIRGERVFFVEAGHLAWSKGGLRAFFGDLSIVQKLGLWTIGPLLKRDLRRSLPVFDRLEGWAARPFPEIRPALRSEGERILARPWYAYISGALIGNFEAAFVKMAQIEAIMLASRAGLACRLYKSRTGRYPESLDELVPGLLGEAPIDPFTGKALIYRREGRGFIVYSLGSNEKDDGGRSTYMITQLVMDKDDDWAWKEDR